jgi:hypothetical protein
MYRIKVLSILINIGTFISPERSVKILMYVDRITYPMNTKSDTLVR